MWLILGELAFAQYVLELTFDDAGNDAELNNMEGGGVQAMLVGGAARTAYGDGVYGRGVELPAGGAVVVQGWQAGDALLVEVWVDAWSDGPIVAVAPGVFLGRQSGQVVWVGPDGPTSLGPWPETPGFHHLLVRLEGLLAAEMAVEVELDFGASRTAVVTPPTAPQLRFGGLEGVLDEVIVANRVVSGTRSAEQDRFNRDPLACVEGAVCEELVLDGRYGDLDFDVPLRMKTVYDPDLCVPGDCPVLVALQGGGLCANDYTSPAELRPMIAAGFFVVTPDPYCEADGRTRVYREELAQLILAKDHVQATYAGRVDLDAYAATGCSHGAEAMMIWALEADDHPARTFVRSASGSGLCARMAGVLCGEGLPPGADLEALEGVHDLSDFEGRVGPEVAASREIARTWGRAFDGIGCEDGATVCNEEGAWGMTYASRRFRDVWQLHEPAEPTGWFAADVSADCQHCAPPESTAFTCGLCLLEVGRGEMENACPQCLSPTDDRDDGLPADVCPLEASWYVDPLGESAIPSPDPPASEPAACGCRVAAPSLVSGLRSLGRR